MLKKGKFHIFKWMKKLNFHVRDHSHASMHMHDFLGFSSFFLWFGKA